MSEFDLVPTAYRRGLWVRRWLTRLGVVLVGIVLVVATTKALLVYGTRTYTQEVEELRRARQVVLDQRARMEQLQSQKADLEYRLGVLSRLRGGFEAKQMFVVIDRALDEHVWFLDWTFVREGELLDQKPEAVETGYFIVVPSKDRKEPERAWRMRAHMEIRAQARDHSALARFVRGLVGQREIEDVRVLSTRVRREASAEVVDFELAVVLRAGV